MKVPPYVLDRCAAAFVIWAALTLGTAATSVAVWAAGQAYQSFACDDREGVR